MFYFRYNISDTLLLLSLLLLLLLLIIKLLYIFSVNLTSRRCLIWMIAYNRQRSERKTNQLGTRCHKDVFAKNKAVDVLLRVVKLILYVGFFALYYTELFFPRYDKPFAIEYRLENINRIISTVCVDKMASFVSVTRYENILTVPEGSLFIFYRQKISYFSSQNDTLSVKIRPYKSKTILKFTVRNI